MHTSIFIAKLLGPIFLVVAVAILVNRERFQIILQEFIRSPAWLYWAGFVGLLAGMAMVLTHNIWVPDWRLIITLIGWVTVVRALISIFRPQWIVTAGTVILEHRGAFVGAAVFNLIIGLELFRLRGVNAASAKWASMLGTSQRTKQLGSEAEWCCRSGLN